ncbi:MAG: hypothetical protein QOI39_2733 [Mycobacterium sp.]|nr:hypothetical protein [Mycobacterium sp.]
MGGVCRARRHEANCCLSRRRGSNARICSWRKAALRLLGTVRFAPVSPILADVPRRTRGSAGSLLPPTPLGFSLDFTKLTDLRFGQPFGRNLQDFGSVLVDEIGRRANPGKLSRIPDRCSPERSRTRKDRLLRLGQQIQQLHPEQNSEISQRRPPRHLPPRRPLPHRLLRRTETLRDLVLPHTMHTHQPMKVVGQARVGSRHGVALVGSDATCIQLDSA